MGSYEPVATVSVRRYGTGPLRFSPNPGQPLWHVVDSEVRR